MSKAIHSMIRVVDEERSVKFYEQAFGLTVADRFPFDSFTLVYLRNNESDFELELTINHGHEAYSLGDGYGHMAFAVDNLEKEHARFTDANWKPTPVKDFAHEGKILARFFFVQDPDGYKIEVLQKYGRYQ